MFLKFEKEITSNDIISFLEEKLSVKMPEEGYLAGQAVASSYFELKNLPFAPVYNDLDIFTCMQKSNSQFNPNNLKNNLSFEGSMGVVSDGYKENIIHIRENFIVTDSLKNGIFNITGINKPVSLNTLVNSFDFNCVQIAIDLKTRELYKSSDFDLFCDSGCLDISNIGTPHHSIIRYFKKAKEMEIKKINKTEIMDKMEFSISIIEDITEKRYNHSDGVDFYLGRFIPSFGKRYMGLALENKKELSEFFYMIKGNDRCAEEGLFKLMPKKKRDNVFCEEYKNNLIENGFNLNPSSFKHEGWRDCFILSNLNNIYKKEKWFNYA